MPKRKGQALDFKIPKTGTEGLHRAIWGDRAGVREREWATVLAEYNKDPEWKTGAEAILSLLARAAAVGDGETFYRLGRCVEWRKRLGNAWEDRLSHEMVKWTRGWRPDSVFNVEAFLREHGADYDDKTVRARARALGYRLRAGRPKGAKNLPH